MSRPLTRAAVARGYEVLWSPKGTDDDVIFERAKKEKSVILSFDTDFFDTAKFPLANTPGRIVLNILPTIFEFQRERFEAFLKELPKLDIENKLVIVTEDQISILDE